MKTRKTTECTRGSADEAHLFVCSGCRTEARLAAAWAAWKDLEAPREAELAAAPPVDPAFVRGVLDLVRADRARTTRIRFRLAAAAALLFFFLVGASQRFTSATSSGAEDTYAQLVSPDLEAELPDAPLADTP